jgi:branched-subunit amino acid aminotransferase/4-amino-4-deoxychorismate lyase
MPEPWAYRNGSFVPLAQAGLPLHDAGFVFGVTVTDLVRTFKQRLYRWPQHLARFRRGCETVHLQLPFDDATLTEAAIELVARNAALMPNRELCLVVFATPGPIGYYLGERGGLRGPITIGMHTFPLPFERYRSLVEEGATLRVPAVRQLPMESVPPAVKTRSRLHWWLADHAVAEVEPSARALLLDEDDHVTETAIANFLIVRGGKVISPRREKVLPGISLEVVAELCDELRIDFLERDLTIADCVAADEAMICGTAFCLAGVRHLEERTYPFPGPTLGRLLERWNAAVGLDIHEQIRRESHGS